MSIDPPDRELDVHKMRNRIAGAGLLVLVACATAGGFRERNRENLDRLRVGMTRDEVFGLMGTGTARVPEDESGSRVRLGEDSLAVTRVEIPVGGSSRTLTNPHRTETWMTETGTWEVLYYYTRLVEDDGRVGDDELTPVVLRDDSVVGWGWEFWGDEVRRHDLPVAVPRPDTLSSWPTPLVTPGPGETRSRP